MNRLAVGILAALWVGPALGQTLTEADWLPLTNEPSRGELLRMATPQLAPEIIQNSFVFPQDTLVDSSGADRKSSVFGIDISHYTDSSLKFNQLSSQDIRFVYMKATQGTTYKDPKFAQFWGAVASLSESTKVLRGAYHFMSSDPSETAVTQADRFVAYVNLHGGFIADDMAPCLDLEWDLAGSVDGWASRTPDDIVSAALDWMNEVQRLTGKVPMLYTSRSWWRSVNIPDADIAKFAGFPIWVADYSRASLEVESPGVPNNAAADLWQFSESAKLSAGYDGGLDANIFKGTFMQFVSTFISNGAK